MPIPPERRRAAAAVVADIACVAAFVAVGRRNHEEGLTLAGIAGTAWPFLAGASVGWLLSRGWRRPLALIPTGVTVWLCTVVIGMLVRKATAAGTAASFVVVAALVTALLMLGWRAVAGRYAAGASGDSSGDSSPPQRVRRSTSG